MMTAIKNHSYGPAVDCHFHIIDPQRFPLTPGIGYQPRSDETGMLDDFKTCMAEHGISCGLAVQPSGYGYDNAALLDALKRSAGHLKGIAVIPPGTAAGELARMKSDGIVGLRFNFVDFDPTELTEKSAVDFLAAARAMDWFAEIHVSAKDFSRIEPLVRRSRVRVLIDHLGRPDPRLGPAETGFKKILALADSGRAVVKLSGAFRESRRPHPFEDLDPFVEAIIAAFTPQNCVWGSDWPFLNVDPKPDYRDTLACLKRWLPDEDQRRIVLWDTPAKLFGFG